MKKIFSIIFMVASLGSLAFARQPGARLSNPVFKDEGTQQNFYRVGVGNNSSTVQPYFPDLKNDRSVTIQNVGNTDMLISSWSAFSQTEGHIVVPKSSGTITLWSNATYYMLRLPGSTTEPVNIMTEGDYGNKD